MSATSRDSTESARFPAKRSMGRMSAWLVDSAGKSPHAYLLVPDPIACSYLQKDPTISLILDREIIHGFEAYIVEDWACSRKHPSAVICIETKDKAHTIAVSVFAIPTNPAAWSSVLCIYLDSFEAYHAEPCTLKIGTLMVTTTSTFPSGLNIVRIPQGDISQRMTEFVVNLNLKRLECAGRAQLTLSKPNDATLTKFREYETDGSLPLNVRVIELVRVIQTCLVLFGMIETDFTDGFFCDITRAGLEGWWLGLGSEHFNRSNDQSIQPILHSVIAALFGLLAGARLRLNSINAPVSKCVLDMASMRKGIRYFQESYDIATTTPARLDVVTLQYLHRKTARLMQEKGRTVQRSVKSTVAGLGGKGVERMIGKVSRGKDITNIETDEYTDFVKNIREEEIGWVWSARGKKPSNDITRAFPTPYLSPYITELNVYSPRKRTGTGVSASVAGDHPDSDAGGEKQSYFHRAGRRVKGAVRHGHLSRQSRDSNGSGPALSTDEQPPLPEDAAGLLARAQSRIPEIITPGSYTAVGSTPKASGGLPFNLKPPIPTGSKVLPIFSTPHHLHKSPSFVSGMPLNEFTSRPALPLTPNACPFDQEMLPDIPCFPSLDIECKETQLLGNMGVFLRRSQSETKLADLHPVQRAQYAKTMETKVQGATPTLDDTVTQNFLEEIDRLIDHRLPRSVSFSVAEEAILWWPRGGLYPIRPARKKNGNSLQEKGGIGFEDDMDLFDLAVYDSDSDISCGSSVDLMPMESNRPAKSSETNLIPLYPPDRRHKHTGSRWRQMIANVASTSGSAAPSALTSPSYEQLVSQAGLGSFPRHMSYFPTYTPSNTPANTTPQLGSPSSELPSGDFLTRVQSAIPVGSPLAQSPPGNPPPTASIGYQLSLNAHGLPTTIPAAIYLAHAQEISQRSILGTVRGQFLSNWLKYVIPAQTDLLVLRYLDRHIQKLSDSIERATPKDVFSPTEIIARLEKQQKQMLSPGTIPPILSRMPTRAPNTPTTTRGPTTTLGLNIGETLRPERIAPNITPPNTSAMISHSLGVADFDDRVESSVTWASQTRYDRDMLTRRITELEGDLDRYEREVEATENHMMDMWHDELDLAGSPVNSDTEEISVTIFVHEDDGYDIPAHAKLIREGYRKRAKKRQSRGVRFGGIGGLGSSLGIGGGSADSSGEDDYAKNLSATATAIRTIVHSISFSGAIRFATHPDRWAPAMMQMSADARWTKWWGWRRWWSSAGQQKANEGEGQVEGQVDGQVQEQREDDRTVPVGMEGE